MAQTPQNAARGDYVPSAAMRSSRIYFGNQNWFRADLCVFDTVTRLIWPAFSSGMNTFARAKRVTISIHRVNEVLKTMYITTERQHYLVLLRF